MAGSGSSLIDLLQVEAGKETTWGTAVTATAKLMGIQDIKLNPNVRAKVYHDIRGSMAPGTLSALTEVMPEGKMTSLGLYEDICYHLDSLLGLATPSGSNPYTRDYAAPIASVPSPRIQTLIYGDATNCYRLSGALLGKTTIKGSNGGAMMIASDIFGQLVDAGTLAALSDRAVNVAMGDHVAIYVDAWGGTIGTTALAATSFSYELSIDPKRKPDQYLGSLTASSYHEDDGAKGWDAKLKLSLEFNAASKAQYDALIATSGVYQKQVRIKSTSGTKVIQFDFAGTSEESPAFGEDRDGVLTFDVELTGTYNSTLGNYLKAQVINAVSALA